MSVPRVSANAAFTVIPCFVCVMAKAFATNYVYRDTEISENRKHL